MLLATILLTACSKPEPEVITNTVVEKISVPIQQRPRQVDLYDVSFRVVTHENLEEFIESIKVGDQYVFVAFDVREYEKMAMNLDELRRYIEQQQTVIVYYEENLKDAQ